MKVLIVTDEITNLQPKSDTGLALVRAALTANFAVYQCEPSDIYYANNKVLVEAKRVETCPPKQVAVVSPNHELLRITSFAHIWIRKDPPVDVGYTIMCQLLQPFELAKTIAIKNSPSKLLQFQEKYLPLQAVQLGYLDSKNIIPTWIGHISALCIQNIPDFLQAKELIAKPWQGYAGKGIQRVSSLANFVTQEKMEKHWLLQPFTEAIFSKGDRRVLFIAGKYVGDFVRYPAPNEFRANLAQGGMAKLEPLSAEQKQVIVQIEKFLQDMDIFLAGADLIDDQVTEINITAPTGFETLRDLANLDLAAEYIAAL